MDRWVAGRAWNERRSEEQERERETWVVEEGEGELFCGDEAPLPWAFGAVPPPVVQPSRGTDVFPPEPRLSSSAQGASGSPPFPVQSNGVPTAPPSSHTSERAFGPVLSGQPRRKLTCSGFRKSTGPANGSGSACRKLRRSVEGERVAAERMWRTETWRSPKSVGGKVGISRDRGDRGKGPRSRK